MRRFRFRLQGFLNLKEQEEKLQRLKFAQALLEYQEHFRVLQRVQEELEQLQQAKRELRRGQVQPEYLIMGELYEVRKQKEKEEREGIVDESKKRLTKAEESFQQVLKEKKMLERMKERAWKDYYQEYLRQEQKNLDDVGNLCFWRHREETR
jgi:flagellar FliJ protein